MKLPQRRRLRRYYEKQREKRRLAREKSHKVKEERKRAREVKEEKWTNKNEHLLVSEHRKIQRHAHLAAIRSECAEMMEIFKMNEKEKEERRKMLRKAIDEEVEDIKQFLDETCHYYDDIHRQISPPEEKNIDELVENIEKDMKQMFDVFQSCFSFEPKYPEITENNDEKDKTFTKDIEILEAEISKNEEKSVELAKEIAKEKNEIDVENVKFAAVKKEKATDKMLKEKKIGRMEERLMEMKEDVVEIGMVGDMVDMVIREGVADGEGTK